MMRASTNAMNTPIVPTFIEVQIACSVREKMSLPVLVGAEEVDFALVHAEQMRVHRDQVEKLVFIPFNEELHILALVLVHRGHPAEIGLDRAFAFDRVDEGPHRTAVFVAELRNLRGAVGVILVAARDGRIIGRQERGEDARQDQRHQDHGGHKGGALFLEPRPDQADLARR